MNWKIKLIGLKTYFELEKYFYWKRISLEKHLIGNICSVRKVNNQKILF